MYNIKERSVKELRVVAKQPTLFYVGARGKNFGDTINTHFFERVFGIAFKRAYTGACDVVTIGSLMQDFTIASLIKSKKIRYLYKYSFKSLITVGTGFAFDIDKTGFLYKTYRKINPLVLRGKLSHKALEKINAQKYENVAYGDMGLLFNLLLEKTPSKKYSVGIIPHNTDIKNPVIEKLNEMHPHSTIISLSDDPMDILERIAECETVISSSLHGLVAADSLNIPNQRIKLSNHNFSHNVDFKFDDYYTAICDKAVPYIYLMDDVSTEKLELLTPEKISENYILDYSRIKQQQEVLLQKGKELKGLL